MLTAIAIFRRRVFHVVDVEPSAPTIAVCGRSLQDGPETVLLSPGLRMCALCRRRLAPDAIVRVYTGTVDRRVRVCDL